MPRLVLPLALALLLPLVLVPHADAFGWCTAVGPRGHECRTHTACIGWSWDSRGERCTIGVPGSLCDWTCVGGAPLP